MSIGTALNIFLEEYQAAHEQEFAGNPLADFIRNDIPAYVNEAIELSDRYLVKASAGQGNWANVPWVAVFDKLITESAQDGYYLVFLVKEDYSGAYLSLNQGVTTIHNLYGADAKHALRVRAADHLARLGPLPKNILTGPINLAAERASSLGSLYEQGNIGAKYYAKGSVPNDEVLEEDLRIFLSMYYALATKELFPGAATTEEEDEKGLLQEDLTKLKEHKQIERNRKLAQKVKKVHGYKCQACGFDFEKKYGELGRGFIEAHHLTPLSHLKGEKVSLDPRKDFSVLCANCHRMIHKTEFVSRVEDFRAAYIVD